MLDVAVDKRIENEIPPRLRKDPMVKAALGAAPVIALKFTFPGKDNLKGVFVVSEKVQRTMAGLTDLRQPYLVILGDKILEAGYFVGDGRSSITSTHSATIRSKSPNVDDSLVQSGLLPFEISIRFHTVNGSLTVTGDKKVVASGDIAPTLLTNGTLERKKDTVIKKISTDTVPNSRKIVSIEEHAIETTRRIMRANPERPITDFSNTIVCLWRHVPSMVTTAVNQIKSALEGREYKILNLLLEGITKDDSVRWSVSHTLEKGRSTKLAKQLQNGSRFNILYKPLVDALKRMDTDGTKRLQVYLIDINLSTELGQRAEKATNRLNSSGKELFNSLRKGESNIADLTEHLQGKQSINAEREELCLSQIQKYGLTNEEDAVNVIMIGAGHHPLLKELPGAGSVTAVVPLKFKDRLGEDAYHLLNNNSYRFMPFSSTNDSTEDHTKVHILIGAISSALKRYTSRSEIADIAVPASMIYIQRLLPDTLHNLFDSATKEKFSPKFFRAHLRQRYPTLSGLRGGRLVIEFAKAVCADKSLTTL